MSEELTALYNTANRSQRIQYAHKKRKEGLTIDEIAYLMHSSAKTIAGYLTILPENIPEDKSIVRERQHQAAIQEKLREMKHVRHMFEVEHMSLSQISKRTHHSQATIKRYLDPDYSPISGHYDIKIPGKLAPYENEIREMRSVGITYEEIRRRISKKGYSGSTVALRMFMQRERAHFSNSAGAQPTSGKEYLFRKTLNQLVYHELVNVKLITLAQYEALLKQYPELAYLYGLVKEFNQILFSKKTEDLSLWIKKASSFDKLPELQSFVEGLKSDMQAVKNAIQYDYNNGLAEGSVTKIKLMKRIMYGRNSFELLKSKVLLHEKLYSGPN